MTLTGNTLQGGAETAFVPADNQKVQSGVSYAVRDANLPKHPWATKVHDLYFLHRERLLSQEAGAGQR